MVSLSIGQMSRKTGCEVGFSGSDIGRFKVVIRHRATVGSEE